jgi:hypothetical protein
MSSAVWSGEGWGGEGLLYKQDFVLWIYTKIYLTEGKFSLR